MLVDLMIQLNSTRPLRHSVRKDLEPLLKIRFFAIDFFIFAEAPSILWTQFTQLQGLTIVIYAVREVPRGECREVLPLPDQVEKDLHPAALYPTFKKRAD